MTFVGLEPTPFAIWADVLSQLACIITDANTTLNICILALIYNQINMH
jgi:hypothetical protein